MRVRRYYDMDRVRRYAARLHASGASAPIDERTFADLDIDAVFDRIDRTESIVGQLSLYARVVDSAISADARGHLDRAATRLADDGVMSARVAAALRRLTDWRAFMLPETFLGDMPRRPFYWPIFPLLTIGAVVSIAAIAWYPRALFALMAIGILNAILKAVHKDSISGMAAALHMVPSLLRTGREFEALDCAELDAERTVLRAHLPALRPVSLSTTWLSLEPGQTNELIASLYEYVNLALGLDLLAFAICIKGMRDHRNDLRAVFDAIGSVDVALSLSRWRGSLETWCTPVFTSPGKRMQVKRLVHPLLDEAVPNDLVVDGAGVLVTGSNMSGKTTFIRAVGINVILAQSLNTALAEVYEAPELVVRASIGRNDDLNSGKSYYLAEVESIGALVAASGGERQQLFLIDEIFRGTNTTERVAAGRAVLAWLTRADDIVLVATHDLELLDLLDGQYRPFHFREQVVHDELYFDYTMRAGISSTRNAIALLRLMHFPQPLVDDATATAERLAQRTRGPGGEPATFK
jgi:hypothetical protein